VPRPGTRAVVVVVGLVLATLVAVAAIVLVVGVPFGPGRSDLERAVAGAPAGTERASWTDWDGVRAELGSDVDARSGADELRTFLDQAYDADLSSRSAVLQSAHLDADMGSVVTSPTANAQ